MKYKISEQFNKTFFIDLGLRPGYEETGASFSIDDVKEWYMQWQKDRAEKSEPYFSGITIPTSFVYAFKENGEVKGFNESSVRIEGEITKEYHGDIFENEEKILEIIFDLAKILGTRAKQDRVHIMFNNHFFVLQKN